MPARLDVRGALAGLLAILLAISIVALQPASTAQAFTSTRYAGADRYATSVEVSKWSSWTSTTVFLASGRSFADALAAGPVVAAERGRLLLTEPGAVPASVMAELVRIDPDEVVLVGSEATISDAVRQQVDAALDVAVTRIGGVDRVDTSLLLLDRLAESGPISAIWVVSGSSYADALVASSVAGRDRAGIVLDHHGPSAADAAAWRARIEADVVGRTVHIAGGTPSVSAADEQLLRDAGALVERHAGSNRYTTAQVVNDAFTPSAANGTMLLAPGDSFPDALSASVLSAVRGWPLYLSPSQCHVDVSAMLRGERDQRSVDRLIGIGGRLTGAAIGLADCRPAPPPAPVPTFSPLQSAMGQRYGMFVPMTFTGTGSQVVQLGADIPTGLVTITGHTGFGAINVVAIDAAGREASVAWTPGFTTGTYLFDRPVLGAPARALRITAPGAWTLQVRDIRYASELSGRHVFGSGDAVVLSDGAAGGVTFTYPTGDGFRATFTSATTGQTIPIGRPGRPQPATATLPGGPGYFIVTTYGRQGTWGIFR